MRPTGDRLPAEFSYKIDILVLDTTISPRRAKNCIFHFVSGPSCVSELELYGGMNSFCVVHCHLRRKSKLFALARDSNFLFSTFRLRMPVAGDTGGDDTGDWHCSSVTRMISIIDRG